MILTIGVLLLAISGIRGQCLTGNDAPPTMNSVSKMSLTDARFDFALHSLKTISQIDSENVFFSPHSLHQAFSLAYFGARGSTEQVLRQALHIPNELSKIEVQRYYAFENSLNELRELNTSGNYEYKIANKLWLTSSKRLRECMLDFFGEQLERTDFRKNPEQVRVYINNWVTNTTKGHIRDLLPVDSITEDTDMVLANAVYFKGQWSYRFETNRSERDIFYTSGSKNVFTTFMRQKGNFNHVVSEELGAYILELPYKGKDVSMFIFLPPFSTARSTSVPDNKPQDGIHQLVERMSMGKNLQELHELLHDGMPPREVEVSFPRFKIEKDLQVGQLLNVLGAGELLTPTADLRGFVDDGEEGLHLGDAVHRARIEVTEEGTTAAAATALFSFRSSRPTEPAIFNANHPFVYMIYDKPSRTILFVGIFREPAQSA